MMERVQFHEARLLCPADIAAVQRAAHIAHHTLVKHRDPVPQALSSFFELCWPVKKDRTSYQEAMPLHQARVFRDAREVTAVLDLDLEHLPDGFPNGPRDQCNVALASQLDDKPTALLERLRHTNHSLFRFRYPVKRRIRENGIERLCKREIGCVSHNKLNIGIRCPCGLNHFQRVIDAQNLGSGFELGEMTRATPNIQDALPVLRVEQCQHLFSIFEYERVLLVI